MHQASVWIENVSEMHLGRHMLELQLGLRETQLLHLDSRYYLHNRPYLDPRVNLKWTLPSAEVAGFPLVFELAGGIGQHTKMPVAAFLYPDPVYNDYVELNYFHNNPAYRTMSVRTFVDDPTNYDLHAARNLKWEVRADVTYRGNRLSVDYFREDMKDAFRMAPRVFYYAYNRYDASAFDPDAAGRAPQLSDLPYEEDRRTALVGSPDNSSRVKKEGVEFTFSSVRIPLVRTRITVSGAWLKTVLSNSQDLWYRPGTVVNGRELQLVGLYDDREGSTYQSFNTNFTFDTDVPRLGLNFRCRFRTCGSPRSVSSGATELPTAGWVPTVRCTPSRPSVWTTLICDSCSARTQPPPSRSGACPWPQPSISRPPRNSGTTASVSPST